METQDYILIGFCQPKFYKRSVWNKAVKVMEWLSDNTNGEVVRYDYGRGKGKYSTTLSLNTENVNRWANLYNSK